MSGNGRRGAGTLGHKRPKLHVSASTLFIMLQYHVLHLTNLQDIYIYL